MQRECIRWGLSALQLPDKSWSLFSFLEVGEVYLIFEGKPLMERIFSRCTNCSYLQLWNFLAVYGGLKLAESIDILQAPGSHEVFLSSCTALKTLFGATALPKIWWSPAQAAPLAGSLEEKVEEEKHICGVFLTIQPWPHSLFTSITCKRAKKNVPVIVCIIWFAVIERILVAHVWPCHVLHLNPWHPLLALWPIQIPPSSPVFPFTISLEAP